MNPYSLGKDYVESSVNESYYRRWVSEKSSVQRDPSLKSKGPFGREEKKNTNLYWAFLKHIASLHWKPKFRNLVQPGSSIGLEEMGANRYKCCGACSWRIAQVDV